MALEALKERTVGEFITNEYKKGKIASPALMGKSFDQKKSGSIISQITVPWTVLGTILLTILTWIKIIFSFVWELILQ